MLTNGTGQTLTLTYDANAQLDAVTLPPFALQADVVDVSVDGRGQLLSVTRQLALGPATTTYSYDANGNRTGITDPRGEVMAFTFDAFGRMLTYTDKLGHTPVVYTYDDAGREQTKTNRNGEVVATTYDSAGRLATVTGPGIDREYRYDALGRPTYSRADAHVETRTYDGAYLVEVAVPEGPMDVAYDAANRRETFDGVGYDYDDRGRAGRGGAVGA